MGRTTIWGCGFDRSCLQFFNSTVAPSIMEFYPEVGVKRDVNSKPDAENYGLRGLLSVRYTLVAKDKEDEWTEKALPGWQRSGETAAYAIYENENWVPMGFTYDYYVTADQLDQVSETERAQILCRALLLNEDQVSAFDTLLQPLPDEELTNRSEDAYAADCRPPAPGPWLSLQPRTPASPHIRTMTPTSWCSSACPTMTALPPP